MYICTDLLVWEPAILVPRPSHPSLPGKTESRVMTYLDVWRSGTFLEKLQVKQVLNPRNVAKTVWCRAIDSALTYFTALKKEWAIPPHVQVCHCT